MDTQIHIHHIMPPTATLISDVIFKITLSSDQYFSICGWRQVADALWGRYNLEMLSVIPYKYTQ